MKKINKKFSDRPFAFQELFDLTMNNKTQHIKTDKLSKYWIDYFNSTENIVY